MPSFATTSAYAVATCRTPPPPPGPLPAPLPCRTTACRPTAMYRHRLGDTTPPTPPSAPCGPSGPPRPGRSCSRLAAFALPVVARSKHERHVGRQHRYDQGGRPSRWHRGCPSRRVRLPLPEYADRAVERCAVFEALQSNDIPLFVLSRRVSPLRPPHPSPSPSILFSPMYSSTAYATIPRRVPQPLTQGDAPEVGRLHGEHALRSQQSHDVPARRPARVFAQHKSDCTVQVRLVLEAADLDHVVQPQPQSSSGSTRGSAQGAAKHARRYAYGPVRWRACRRGHEGRRSTRTLPPRKPSSVARGGPHVRLLQRDLPV